MTIKIKQNDMIAPKAIKETIRCFPTSLHILTTNGPFGRRGIVISACMSFSYEPPTFIVGLKKDNRNNRIFIENGSFAINTLALDQQNLVAIFGGKTTHNQDERFEQAEWIIGDTGSPILKDAYISFDCELCEVFESETHYAIRGKVIHALYNNNANIKPLIYANGEIYQP